MKSSVPYDQPPPPDPNWPRYTTKPFPPYRFVPGRSPHPRRHPDGHCYNFPEPVAAPTTPERWAGSETYLFGIDLYNYAYWWECHEQLEALWHAVSHESRQGRFLQGIVQIAAANLHKFMRASETDAGRSLAEKGLARLSDFSGTYMGIDVPIFVQQIRDYFRGSRSKAPLIRLR